MLVLFIIQPTFKLKLDISPGPLHTPLSAPREVSSIGSVTHMIQKGEVRCFLFFLLLHVNTQPGARRTMSQQLLWKRSCCDKMLVVVRANALSTNLILHHGVADIFNHAAKLLHILCVVGELCDLASLCQQHEVLKNIIQLAIKKWISGQLWGLESVILPFEGLPHQENCILLFMLFMLDQQKSRISILSKSSPHD